MGFIAWLLVGLVAGLLARLIVPGRDPMGLLATLVLGLVGSVVGGFLAHVLFGDNNGVGLIGATIGAIIVLLIWNAVTARHRRGVRGFSRRVVS